MLVGELGVRREDGRREPARGSGGRPCFPRSDPGPRVRLSTRGGQPLTGSSQHSPRQRRRYSCRIIIIRVVKVPDRVLAYGPSSDGRVAKASASHPVARLSRIRDETRPESARGVQLLAIG